MRFERLRLVRFGRLRELDTGPDPLGRLAVIWGPNEAGKSTLFHFLCGILYGLYPATRDANPYTPWDEGDIEGSASIRTDDGEVVEVRRRLLSSPRGSLIRGEREEVLDNRTVPFVRHVHRDLFRQLYALTLAELTGLEEESWAEVEDRLLGRMGAMELRPPREVAAALEEEAGALWRPNRRGNQRIRELAAEIRELRQERRAASDRDRELREKARRLEEARSELGGARRERERLRIREERVSVLLPVRKQLARIAELEAAAGPPGALEGMPAEPERRLEELRARARELDGRLESLEESAEAARERDSAFGAAEEGLLAEEEALASLVARAAGSAPIRSQIAAAAQEIRDLEGRVRSRGRELFTVPLDEVDLEAAREVPAGELRDRLRAYREARRERRVRAEARRLARAAGEDAARWDRWVPVALVLSGAMLAAWGALRGEAVPGAVGAVLIVVGTAAAAARRGRGGGVEPEDGGSGPDLREALERVRSILEGLPLREALVEDPHGELAGLLEDLQESLDRIEDRRRTLDGLRERLGQVEAELEEVAGRHGLSLPEDVAAAGHALGQALERARGLRQEATAAGRELERIRREREDLDKERGALEEELGGLEDALEELGGGEIAAGVAEARRRRDAREGARKLLEELERSHPDLDELRARIRTAESRETRWTLDDEARARIRTLIEDLSARVEGLEGEVRALEEEIRHRSREATVAELESRIQGLREEQVRLTEERDRKALLARLLREADRRFREAHQPDVLRRAGAHLEAITGGRYDRVLLSEDDDGGARFRLRDPGTGRTLALDPPLSTGTREQVYLALRLAIVDHLDRDAETLPLFVDEAFVNWDPERRGRGFDLLQDLSRRRQIFVFTCHRPMAGALEERGAALIRLSGPE